MVGATFRLSNELKVKIKFFKSLPLALTVKIINRIKPTILTTISLKLMALSNPLR